MRPLRRPAKFWIRGTEPAPLHSSALPARITDQLRPKAPVAHGVAFRAPRFIPQNNDCDMESLLMDDHYRKLENLMHSAPIVQLTGARVAIDKGRADITLPVRRDFFHAANALHGSIYFLALDNAAFFAVNSLVEEVFVLTIQFSIVLIRPVVSGTIKAIGKVAASTATHFYADSILYDSEGKEIARGSGIFVKSRIKLSPEIGYK